MDDITTRALDGDLFAVQALVVERDALKIENAELHGEIMAAQLQEPFVWIYEYRWPFDGTPVWRFENNSWNGQQAKSEKPLYAQPTPPVVLEKLIAYGDYSRDDAYIEGWNDAIDEMTAPTLPSVQNEIGIPACGGPLCNEMDHHPLCSKAPTLPKPGEE